MNKKGQPIRERRVPVRRNCWPFQHLGDPVKSTWHHVARWYRGEIVPSWGLSVGLCLCQFQPSAIAGARSAFVSRNLCRWVHHRLHLCPCVHVAPVPVTFSHLVNLFMCFFCGGCSLVGVDKSLKDGTLYTYSIFSYICLPKVSLPSKWSVIHLCSWIFMDLDVGSLSGRRVGRWIPETSVELLDVATCVQILLWNVTVSGSMSTPTPFLRVSSSWLYIACSWTISDL